MSSMSGWLGVHSSVARSSAHTKLCCCSPHAAKLVAATVSCCRYKCCTNVLTTAQLCLQHTLQLQSALSATPPLTRLDQVLGGDADWPLLLLLQLGLGQDVLQAGVQAALGEACSRGAGRGVAG